MKTKRYRRRRLPMPSGPARIVAMIGTAFAWIVVGIIVLGLWSGMIRATKGERYQSAGVLK